MPDVTVTITVSGADVGVTGGGEVGSTDSAAPAPDAALGASAGAIGQGPPPQMLGDLAAGVGATDPNAPAPLPLETVDGGSGAVASDSDAPAPVDISELPG